jgi:hypothetical protein
MRAFYQKRRLFETSLCDGSATSDGGTMERLKDWEIIADNLHDAGWSLGWVSAVDSEGRTIWIVDAHRDNGKRLVVRADEKLIAFSLAF